VLAPREDLWHAWMLARLRSVGGAF
jgi:hypothetical protein